MVVAILGHGTVGGGVYELLKNRSDITVKYVLDRSPIAELGAVSVTDFSTILNDGEWIPSWRSWAVWSLPMNIW